MMLNFLGGHAVTALVSPIALSPSAYALILTFILSTVGAEELRSGGFTAIDSC